MCFVLAVNLVWFPSGATTVELSRSIFIIGVAAYLQQYLPTLTLLFSRASTQTDETLEQRASRVSRLSLTPEKLVAYRGQVVIFSALPTDLLGRTIQGVKVTYESSDPDKVRIDDSGKAVCLSPGLALITCRAGSASTTAPVLVRSEERQKQTDAEWSTDQASLTTTGQDGGASDRSFAASIAEKLIPIVHAQQGGCSFLALGDTGDVGYDELYTDPANLVGTPPNQPVEPFRLGAVFPESSNYTTAIPIYSLPGRGVDLSLALYLNGQVWTRHGSAITFNAVNGWPYAGFSLGFGRLVTYGAPATTRYVFVASNGTRHYLGTGSASTTGTYQTADGTHLTFVGSAYNGGTLYLNNGTRLAISPMNNRLLVTQVIDRNGNYLSVTYRTYVPGNPDTYPQAFPWRQAINTITDSLGRVLQFYYDACGNLSRIDGPGHGGTSQNPVTETLVRFDYQTVTITGTFSGLTVENVPAPPQNQLFAVSHIYFPATDTGLLFSYSAYGVAYNISLRRSMSYDGGTGAISDGVQIAQVSFNYPTSPSSLTSAPAFTQRVESPGGTSGDATYGYSVTDNLIASQTRTFTITRPDSSKLLLTRSTDALSTANGLMVHSEVRNSSNSTMTKSEFSYVVDGGGSPQVQSIVSTDEQGTPTKRTFDFDSYGNVTDSSEYGFQVGGQWMVRRRSRFVYKTDSAYLNAYLRSFVIESNVYDAQLNTSDADDVMIAKSTFTLDDYGAMGGMENYGGAANPPGHLSSYGTSQIVRGNVTGTTQWTDIGAGASITRLAKFDIFGNVVQAQVACCDVKTFTHEESNNWSEASEVTNGTPGSGGLTSSVNRDFNTSVPDSVTDPNGLTVTYTYDDALRPTIVAMPAGGSSTASYDDAALTATFTRAGGGTATEKFDGWGRVIERRNVHNGQVNIAYDAMSRVQSVTNPFPVGGSPSASTGYQYDALGRSTITTLPNGNTLKSEYSGSTVTGIDQVNRKTMWEWDGLGRLITATEQDSSGSLTQSTSYSYNYLDKLVSVNQGNQLRSYKHDALGRLLFERIPEQSATISDGVGGMWSTKYTYTTFNAVQTRTDARGVITTYGYDGLNRLTSITYNTSAAPSVTATNNVTFTYDTSPTSSTKGLLLSISMTGSLPTYFPPIKRPSASIRSIGSARVLGQGMEEATRSDISTAAPTG